MVREAFPFFLSSFTPLFLRAFPSASGWLDIPLSNLKPPHKPLRRFLYQTTNPAQTPQGLLAPRRFTPSATAPCFTALHGAMLAGFTVYCLVRPAAGRDCAPWRSGGTAPLGTFFCSFAAPLGTLFCQKSLPGIPLETTIPFPFPVWKPKCTTWFGNHNPWHFLLLSSFPRNPFPGTLFGNQSVHTCLGCCGPVLPFPGTLLGKKPKCTPCLGCCGAAPFLTQVVLDCTFALI